MPIRNVSLIEAITIAPTARAGTKKKHSTRRSKHLSAFDPVSIGQPTPPAGNYDRTKPRRLGSAD
jgi:hypothetical protein